MPRPSKSSTDDILSLLTPERRAAVLAEALGAQVRGIVQQHQGGTFGGLIDALTSHPHWREIQRVNVSVVLSARRGRPPKSGARRSRAAAAGATPRPRGRPGRLDQGLLVRVMALIQKHPGLRSEEIQKQIVAPKGAVKKVLAKLREQKRVKTTGHKRVTKYAAA